jgi:hypothetical protein
LITRMRRSLAAVNTTLGSGSSPFRGENSISDCGFQIAD